MSSPAVRQAARDLLQSPAWPSSIPYEESFNEYVDPQDIKGQWSTLAFELESDRRLSVGVHEYLEEGTIRVHVFAERGRSFGDLESSFDALRPVVLGHVWPAHITIRSCAAPDIASPGGVGLHVEGVVDISYTYQHTGGT